ncbi:phosphotransferase system glucitol/sorbitol-specific iia component [Lucifera butyrica]|uniref:Phosphotransferase system glucitol/sorbitol-specific iia component n=1 Tax=Lucifera butyrica TaxID=1351585 RepID=A0A498RB30_9FIRM|nr:PTS glucitol/sorbitol transporter subunit IIA [Lucifera butyrica]VBB07343.1 phosphotransferase system glucitol/sorbitol-specific iia component [Lucifera butyrica]
MKYEVEIINIGPLSKELLADGNLVIFDKCPNEALMEISVMHTRGEIKGAIEVGDRVTLGSFIYQITAIGEEALHTLKELGHCTFRFDGADVVDLPGQIALKGDKVPELQVGNIICIE